MKPARLPPTTAIALACLLCAAALPAAAAAPPAAKPSATRPPATKPPATKAAARPGASKPKSVSAKPASSTAHAVSTAPRFVRLHPPGAGPGDRELYERLSAEVAGAWDASRGVFAERDGTPSEGAIELAFARGRDGDAEWERRAFQSLHWTRQLLDTVGGGYVDGLQDKDPRNPRFEKHTLPNARRLELLMLARARTPDASWKHDIAFVTDHFERVLQDPRGGFFTGQIATMDLEPESNGAGVQAWIRAGALTEDPARREFARRTMRRLWGSSHHEDLGLVRRDRLGTIREPSLLLDQTEVGRAHLFLWQATANDSDLILARRCGDHVLAHFADARKGGFRTDYAADRFGRVRRPRRPFDDNARAARFLVELSAATGDSAYVAAARRAWRAFDRQVAKSKLAAAEWALAVRAQWAPDPLPIVRWRDRSRGASVPPGVAEAGGSR